LHGAYWTQPGQSNVAEGDRPKAPDVWLTGVVGPVNGVFWVYLSDGRVYSSQDRELQVVGKRGVVISGKPYWFRPTETAAAAPGTFGTAVSSLVKPLTR
jgi:hypothetical protein